MAVLKGHKRYTPEEFSTALGLDGEKRLVAITFECGGDVQVSVEIEEWGVVDAAQEGEVESDDPAEHPGDEGVGTQPVPVDSGGVPDGQEGASGSTEVTETDAKPEGSVG